MPHDGCEFQLHYAALLDCMVCRGRQQRLGSSIIVQHKRKLVQVRVGVRY